MAACAPFQRGRRTISSLLERIDDLPKRRHPFSSVEAGVGIPGAGIRARGMGVLILIPVLLIVVHFLTR